MLSTIKTIYGTYKSSVLIECAARRAPASAGRSLFLVSDPFAIHYPLHKKLDINSYIEPEMCMKT